MSKQGLYLTKMVSTLTPATRTATISAWKRLN